MGIKGQNVSYFVSHGHAPVGNEMDITVRVNEKNWVPMHMSLHEGHVHMHRI